MRRQVQWKIKLWTLVSLLFFSCSKIIPPKEKKIESFSIYLPLAEDYPTLSNALSSLIKSKFPRAKIQLRDYLAPHYTMAPLDEWLMKAQDRGLLQLVIYVPDLEERDHLVAFIKQNASKLLFYHSLPSFAFPQKEPRASRGEGYFCRMRIESKDILEQQLCHALLSLLCSSSGAAAKNSSRVVFESYKSAPLCALKLSLAPQENQAKKINSKNIILTTFPLPLKVKNDYPFESFTDIEESAIMAVFKE